MTNEELRNYFEKATISTKGGAEGYIKAAKVRAAVLELIDKNTFLLDQIENLKQESIYIELQSAYNRVRNMEDACRKLQEENEQLKSDLEQSIELPCKVADTVYEIKWNCAHGMRYDCRLSDGTMGGSLCHKCRTYPCTLKPIIVEHIFSNVEDIYGIMDRFGFGFFLTREEAEKSLEVQGWNWL